MGGREARQMRCIQVVLIILVTSILAQADQMASPISVEVQKTQHFEKFLFSNSSAVPVTIKVNAQGRNLKLSQRMPHILVIPPRSTKEAFHASPKDPRAYYSRPDVQHNWKWGDYRLTRSNLPLTLPWAKGKSFQVKKLTDSGNVLFDMEQGAEVTCARSGLVVGLEPNGLVMAHNDGSITRYKNVSTSGLRLGKAVKAGKPIGTAVKKSLLFQVAVPSRSLKYGAIPMQFSVGGSKTALTAGKSYKR